MWTGILASVPATQKKTIYPSKFHQITHFWLLWLCLLKIQVFFYCYPTVDNPLVTVMFLHSSEKFDTCFNPNPFPSLFQGITIGKTLILPIPYSGKWQCSKRLFVLTGQIYENASKETSQEKKSRIVLNCLMRYIRTVGASKDEESSKDKKSFLRMGRCILPHNTCSFWLRSDTDVLWKDTALARN